ncbi:MAG: DUF4124 domain-containing protein [Abyssibacter sp.]|uniref:DUF4124 domain-containing protein n=1 Tax=Abyssibacter sp. TaxID=2320200 RepID=UPI00321ABEE2
MIRSLILMTLLSMTSAGLAQSKLYRWVDDNGQVHYGDRIPPQYAKKERAEINERGVVVDVKAREKTSDELAAEQAAALAAAEEAQRAEEQARYDRYLISSFNSVADLMALRDDRLSLLESRLTLARKSVADTEKSLTGLIERRDKLQSAGKPVPDKLNKQISEFESSLVAGLRSVSGLEEEQVETRRKFTNDIERYIELRNN